YGLTRFALEGLRSGNWTFFGIPTASIVTLGVIGVGLVGPWYRHRPGTRARHWARLSRPVATPRDGPPRRSWPTSSSPRHRRNGRPTRRRTTSGPTTTGASTTRSATTTTSSVTPTTGEAAP